MNRLVIALLLCVAAVPALAADNVIVVPDQGWQVSFAAPLLEKQQEQKGAAGYAWLGNHDGLTVSLFVEDPGCDGGDTHDANFACFWPQASRNPMIAANTVVDTAGPRFHKVTYEIHATIQGQPIVAYNINFLFAYRGKWMDLHVSVIEPTAEDMAMLAELEGSLAYGPTP